MLLHQSLNINYIMSAAMDLCAGLRDETGSDTLMDVTLPAAAVVYDLLHALGMPDHIICQALNQDEMHELAMGSSESTLLLRCQKCDDEATQLVPYRGNRLLLCDAHAAEIRSLTPILHH